MPEPSSPLTTHDLTQLAEAFVLHRLSRTAHTEARNGTQQTMELLKAAAGILSLESSRGLRGQGNRCLSVMMTGLAAAVDSGFCRLLLPHPEHGGYFLVQADGTLGGAPSLTELPSIARDVLETGETRFSSSNAALLVPLRWDGRVVGLLDLAAPAGEFTEGDRAICELAAPAIAELVTSLGLLAGPDQGARAHFRLIERPLVADLSGHELVLSKILLVAIEVLDADRGMILLHDAETDELCARYAEGLGGRELRVASRLGLAGAAYHTGEIINVFDAYLDSRFHPAIDWELGYRTRSVLCAPIAGGDGNRIGVVQLLNKRRGPFTANDERMLQALASQMGVTVNYGALFERTLSMRAYNEDMLRSLTNGVVTVDLDGIITFINQAASRILRFDETVVGQPLIDVADDLNIWIAGATAEISATGVERSMPNSELYIAGEDNWVSCNLTLLPLRDSQQALLGVMIVIEDLQREKELRRRMSRYVSNEVIDRLISDPGDALGGTSHPVTILFSDIRGFTAQTERLGAAETVSMLNEYFSFMEDVVTHHRGMIDKYIGDAIMATFGSPYPAPDDAERAVAAAVDMFQALRLLNTRRAGEGKGAIRIGIGIGTGEVISGNIGSPKRMDFTVIGDPVNLSSRIESATKYYAAEILVCETTWSQLGSPQLGSTHRGRLIDIVRLRGQSNRTELWEILDHRPEFSDEAIMGYGAAFEAYRRAEWERASHLFRELGPLLPNDKARMLLAERCDQFLIRSPSHWDGTIDLD